MLFCLPIPDSGHYTNFFHLEIDSNVSAFKKVKSEGPYHKYCNGRRISYVELGETSIYFPNTLSLPLNYSMENNIYYLNYKFPLGIY